MTVEGSFASHLISFVGLGVVVMVVCGLSPSRKPNSTCSHTSSGYFQPATSSAQIFMCCGPRNDSGSSALNSNETAPFGQTRRRFDGRYSGLSLRGQISRIADLAPVPCTITSLTSAVVGPIKLTMG